MTAVVGQTPIAEPSLHVAPLPWSLDLSCPIALPSKPFSGAAWPFPVAGPSSLPYESTDDCIKRRYYETLYLPEVFSPFSAFTDDLLRKWSPTAPSSEQTGLAVLIKPRLLSLEQIGARHRKTILPLLSTATATAEQTTATNLDEKELEVIRFAMELRLGSRRAVDEGVIPMPKRLSDELEKREILMQIILLFLYITYSPSPQPTEQTKKRKRHHRRHDQDDAPLVLSPAEDPKNALDIFMDRLSVWQAVAELGLGHADGGDQKGKGREDDNPIASLLGRFWKDVVVPFLLPKQPELCTTLHLKIFGHPIPAKLLPAPPTTTKKPRKPKMTRARPSSDAIALGLLAPPRLTGNERDRSADAFARHSSSRAPSRASSDAGSRASPPREVVSMRRSVSRTSDTQSRSNSFSQPQTLGQSQAQFRRSRSRSIDPSAPTRPDPHPIPGTGTSGSAGSGGYLPKKAFMRAPSGKDMFKGREVGLMRRTTSKKVEGLGREDSLGHGRFGLLGRKTSGGKESQSQRRGSNEESQRPDTLILATPSKPRHGFGRSATQPQTQWFPTPIQEEPSASRPTGPPSFIAETPVGRGRMMKSTQPFYHEDIALDSGDESDDPLADLMVMTDDEDDEPRQGKGAGRGRDMVPETPVR